MLVPYSEGIYATIFNITTCVLAHMAHPKLLLHFFFGDCRAMLIAGVTSMEDAPRASSKGLCRVGGPQVLGGTFELHSP